jgi:hypothetical protein
MKGFYIYIDACVSALRGHAETTEHSLAGTTALF